MKRGNPTLRVLGAGAALLVAAWLAIGLRATILEERGNRELNRNAAVKDPSPAQARALSRAARDLDNARWLNPDGAPRMAYAQMLVLLGEKPRARRLIRKVVHDEPENLQLWETARAVAIVLPDKALEAEARRRIRELNPRVSRR